MSEESLKTYIDRILEIQETRPMLSDQELRDIAREIGLSEYDLQMIEKQIDDGVQRAIGFMNRSLWKDAVSEWNQVLALSPSHKNGYAKLGYCYLKMGQPGQARSMAEKALQIDPTNQHAFEVIQALPKKGAPSKMIFVGIAVAFFFLLGVLGSVLYLMFGVGEAVNQMPPQKILSEPDSPPVQSFVKTQPLKQHKGSFPITIETPDGIKFDRYVSKYDVYKDSSFYKLRGLVRNVSTLEISELQGTFTYRLADGNQIEDKVSILSRHRPVSRPNDVSEIRELHKITNTTLESVTLKIEIVDSVKAAKNYPPSKEVELNWKGKKKRDIKVRERTQSLGAPSSIGQFFKATWEFENNGPPIRKLKIQARIFDKANELLAEKDMYLTITSAMPIETKGVRIKNTIAKLPKNRFHRYELHVLEVE